MSPFGDTSLPERPWQRAAILFLVSNAVLLFVCAFGLYLWPERLPVNSQNVFWLASGVNVAGLLLFGLRYWPVLLLNAFPAAFLIGEPLGFCVLGATANMIEALVGAWIIGKAGGAGPYALNTLNTLRGVAALLIASLIAPLANTLLIPAYLCATGQYPWSDYLPALGNWNLSNGTAILMITPLILLSVRHHRMENRADSESRPPERVLIALVTALLSYLAYSALFTGKGMNVAFLAFLPILYSAVRFGIRGTILSLNLTLVAIYVALLVHGRHQPIGEMPEILWFAQAITWVLAATGLLLAALGAERRLAEHRSLEASLAAEQARLAALRYQINPHFLFNALNSIRSTLPLPETVTREMITSLSGYLRSTLDSGDRAQAPLQDEINSIGEYLHIEQHRFGDDLDVCFEVDPAVESLPIPVFLLQPLVENAIRHGLEKNPGPCRITLSANRSDKELLLAVTNTGRWQPSSNRTTGTGLRNIRHRLHFLYGSAATLRVDPLPGTVEIHLTLPLA